MCTTKPVGALDDVVDVGGRAKQEVDAPRIALSEHERRNRESSPADVVSCGDDRHRCGKAAAKASNRVSFCLGRDERMLPLVNLPGHGPSKQICLTVQL